MKRIFGLLFFLIVLVIGLFFGVLNAESVTVHYYFGSRQLPLSLVLVVTLLIGAVCGTIASLGLALRLRREISRLRKEVRITEQELANLRALPLKDSR